MEHLEVVEVIRVNDNNIERLINEFKQTAFYYNCIQGDKDREAFVKKYPVERIPELTLDEYVFATVGGRSDSFCRMIYDLMTSNPKYFVNWMGIRRDEDNKYILTENYREDYGGDYKAAFKQIKNDIVSLLKNAENENYSLVERKNKRNELGTPLNRSYRDKLLCVYFPDSFIPVITEGKLEDYFNVVGLPFRKTKDIIYNNFELRDWCKNNQYLGDYNNHFYMSFLDWCFRDKKSDSSSDNHAVLTAHIDAETKKLIAEAEEEERSIQAEVEAHGLEGEDVLAYVKQRKNQGAYRKLLLRAHPNGCCLCGACIQIPSLLVASHIKPWRLSDPYEKTDVDNGLVLCPNHDKLFDGGWITFDNEGKLIISDDINDNDRHNLHLDPFIERKMPMTNGMKFYMEFHRKEIYRKSEKTDNAEPDLPKHKFGPIDIDYVKINNKLYHWRYGVGNIIKIDKKDITFDFDGLIKSIGKVVVTKGNGFSLPNDEDFE